MFNNWEESPLTKLIIGQNNTCSPNQSLVSITTWPGTVAGCLCGQDMVNARRMANEMGIPDDSIVMVRDDQATKANIQQLVTGNRADNPVAFDRLQKIAYDAMTRITGAWPTVTEICRFTAAP